MDKPIWLTDEKDILLLLKWFYSRIQQSPNRVGPPNKKLKDEAFFHSENPDQTWYLLKTLVPQVVQIKLNKRRSEFAPEWSGASITFPIEKYGLIKKWLGLDAKSDAERWSICVGKFESLSADLSKNQITQLHKLNWRFQDKSNDEIIASLLKLIKEKHNEFTLREISAKYFWGDSKFLDSRLDGLMSVAPKLRITARKIQLDYCLPRIYKDVLFVENLDTYHRLLAKPPQSLVQTAMVYAAGFKASAIRIRQSKGVSMSSSSYSQGNAQLFLDWWFSRQSVNLPCYFWGDLDYSALSILKALRVNFKSMQLWQPGYHAMINTVANGGGHSVNNRDKKRQFKPTTIGCQFADQVVLPFLEKHQHFFDQEGVGDLN